MWRILRAHRLEGWKFTRQVPVGPFTLDFAARRERLAIELDGDSHAAQEEYDRHRTCYLEKAGWTVIRVTNLDVVRNPEGVAVTILDALARRGPSPQPSPRRGEGE
jgi:very-short-patch-repair endonuclease